MFTYSAITITGYDSQPLPNLFLKQEGVTDQLALVFPGLNYSADMPLLYYSAQLLLARGADVLNVGYEYGKRADFASADAETKMAWIAADSRAALDAALQARTYRRITLIGKSIGTRAVALLAADDPRLRTARCIWLTPLLHDAGLVEKIRRGGQRGLFIAGTADSHYDAAVLPELVRSTAGKSLIIAGANHSMEIAGDVFASLRALEEILRVTADFLDQ